jgi:integrase
LDLDLGQLQVREVVIHEVPRKGSATTPVLTDGECELDDPMRDYFGERLKSSLSAGHDVVPDACDDCLRGPTPVGRPLVFASSLGGPIEPGSPGRALKKALLGAGLPQVRVHDLRHTAASALLVAGVHPKLVQDRLGHKSIRVTMDTYSHVFPVVHQEAVRKLEALLEELAA